MVKGRDFPIHLDGVSDGEMRAAVRFRELAERFRDLEARFQDLIERLPELAAEPLP